MTVYYAPNQIQSGAFPAILAIGDSWFWYPKVSNLLAEISAAVKPDYSNIMALGYLGARLEEYVNGKYAAAFARELRPGYLPYYSAILISGGGNDAVDWGLCLKDDCSAETTALGCMDQRGLSERMTDLGGWLLAMITEVHAAFDDARLRRADIFIHCYDYAPPNGKGFKAPIFGVPLSGPWLKPAMDKRHVPLDYLLRKEIVRLFIDSLAKTFAEFDSPQDRVYVIESQGTLDPDNDWDNELHPNGEGFRKLVYGPWLDTLRRTRYAF
jgi:hypothetical protein